METHMYYNYTLNIYKDQYIIYLFSRQNFEKRYIHLNKRNSMEFERIYQPLSGLYALFK